VAPFVARRDSRYLFPPVGKVPRACDRDYFNRAAHADCQGMGQKLALTELRRSPNFVRASRSEGR